MEYREIPIEDLELDLDNPRIKQWIEIYGDNLSSEAIALALSSTSDKSTTSSFNSLKESIRVNGGLINPIIVNKYQDGRKVVIEGNTRLQIYKEFAESDPEGPWDKIIAIIYDDLPEEQIHAIRLQTHLVGPRDWDPFSKAKYLDHLSNVEKMPMERIISLCGGKTSEIRKLINAYSDMMRYYEPLTKERGYDFDPKDFSKFVELQNNSINTALMASCYTKKDFAEWVINRNIDTAQNVRDIPKVLENKEARNEFLKNDLSEAIKVINVHTKVNNDLNDIDIYELVQILINKIRNIGWNDIKQLKYNFEFEDKKNNIQTLSDELNALVDDIQQD